MKCYDDNYYEFHEEDVPGKCFLCGKEFEKLFIVRHIASMKMIHLCPVCMVNNMSDFLLDNTRPWAGTTQKRQIFADRTLDHKA